MSENLIGKVINERYHLTDILGEGGMGIVFRAEDLRLNNRLCAVKLLKGKTTDPNEAKRFEYELQIISKLRSPHVVQVLDTGYFEGHRLYIVMELLEGDALSTTIKKEGAFALERAIKVARGILAGLSEAHEYNVIHRDLKPANIFISQSRSGDEITKVLDFGIAKDITKDSSTLTSASLIIGTPKYMAPEQFLKKTTDVRTDIYAVGLLLYHMLAGQPPFMDSNPRIPDNLGAMPVEFKLGWMHLNLDPDPLPIPQKLWKLIASMMDKQNTERPQSANVVIQILNDILKDVNQSGKFHQIHSSNPNIEVEQIREQAHALPPTSTSKSSDIPPATTGNVSIQVEPKSTSVSAIINPDEELGLSNVPTQTSNTKLILMAVGVMSLSFLGTFFSGLIPTSPQPTQSIILAQICTHVFKVSPSKTDVYYRGKKITRGRRGEVLVRRPCDQNWEVEFKKSGYQSRTQILKDGSNPKRQSITLSKEKK
jgi:serine/threonine-protein kinase